MRLILAALFSLLSSTALAVEADCASLPSTSDRPAMAFCKAYFEDKTDCTRVGDEALKPLCFALATGNSSTCNNLSGDAQSICKAMATRTASSCKDDKSAGFGWCTATLRLVESGCGRVPSTFQTSCKAMVQAIKKPAVTVSETPPVVTTTTEEAEGTTEEADETALPSYIGDQVKDDLEGIRRMMRSVEDPYRGLKNWLKTRYGYDATPEAVKEAMALVGDYAEVKDEGSAFYVQGEASTREAVIEKIKDALPQNGHGDISQALNDMELGRGKATTGHAGVLHASAGIADAAGGCTLFFVRNEDGSVNLVGVGQHTGSASYQIFWKATEGPGSTLPKNLSL